MPVFFQTPLENSDVRAVAITNVNGNLVLARRGPDGRILLSVQHRLHPQGFGLYDEYACEEKTDAEPALATLNQQAYIVWKANGYNEFFLGRIGYNERGITGLLDVESLDTFGSAPLTLVGDGDRLLLGHTDGEGNFAFASIVPFDFSFNDPLLPNIPGCDICMINDEDEFSILGNIHPWNLLGRYSSLERLTLGDGWYTLLLALKEGVLEHYHSGITAEWQAVVGEQQEWDQLNDPEALELDLLVYMRLAVCDASEVKQSAQVLKKLSREQFRERYDALAKTSFARLLSDKDFEAAWKTLQELTAFFQRAADKGMQTIHRTQYPAMDSEPMPEVGVIPETINPELAVANTIHPDGVGIFAEAMDSFGIKAKTPINEWPFNVLSQTTVRYGSGRFARAADDPQHDYDPAELERCNTIATEAAARFVRLPVRTNQLGELIPFVLPINRHDVAPADLTADYIRQMFRGTLNPWTPIDIQSAAEFGVQSLRTGEADFYGYSRAQVRSHNEIWNDNSKWLNNHPDLIGKSWYVSIDGGIYSGAKAIRLIVGMTKAGSLTGVVTVMNSQSLFGGVKPKQAYTEFMKMDYEEFRKWIDPKTKVPTAKMILRSYRISDFGPWSELINDGMQKVRERDRTKFWLKEYRKLQPTRTLTIPSAWNAVLRCIRNGRLDSNWATDPLIVDSWHRLTARPTNGDAFYSYSEDDVYRAVNWFKGNNLTWLRARYDMLRATDYAEYLSEADWQKTADAYQAIVEFYQHAQAGNVIVVEMTTKSDETLIEESSATEPAPQTARKKKRSSDRLTDCEPDDEKLIPLLPCMETYGMGDGQWPHNDISTTTVRYSCGNIGAEGVPFEHDHDPAELARCEMIAKECEKRLDVIDPPDDMGGKYLAFFSTANINEPVQESLSEEWIRNRLFRGMINPEVSISIGALTAHEIWHEDTAAVGFVDWFRAQPGLHGFALVSIGLSEDEGGAAHPRLALAITDRGSIVGVCGHVIWA